MAALPLHLQPRFEIVTRDNRSLGAGRDLRELCARVQARCAPASPALVKRALQRWERFHLEGWTIGDLPERCLIGDDQEVPFYLYPGVHAEKDAVSLRLFRSREDAAAASRVGVPRLAERVLEKELAAVQRDLRTLQHLARNEPFPGPEVPLADAAWENLRVHLLEPPEPIPRNAAEFACYVSGIRRQLPGLAAALLAHVRAILDQRRRTLDCRHPFPGLAAAVEALVPPQFLRIIPFSQLAHIPRYLRALQIRAERAALQPAKDAARAERVRPYAVELDRWMKLPAPHREAHRGRDRVRWLLEEFKVSVFAQELGTAVPVSARRLDEALEEMRRLWEK